MSLKDVTFMELLHLFAKALPALLLAYLAWALVLLFPFFILGFFLGLMGAVRV